MPSPVSTPPVRFASTLPVEGRVSARSSAVTCPDSRSSPAKPRFHDQRAAALAKSLRKRPTGPEAKLWAHLKRIQTLDTHFRKQAPFGRYVLDFVCHRAKLVIEVDGDQHGWDRHAIRDEVRYRFLTLQGYRVLRFSNLEVLQEMEAVLETIYDALHGSDVPRSHSKRASRRELPEQNLAHSSPSMGEVARRAGGGGPDVAAGETL